MLDQPLIINLFGGPGSGKSTMAARIFSELKEKNYNAELVTEYAKDLTWQESFKVLSNQVYVFAKQYHRIWRLQDVDVVITDSPLLMSVVYGDTSKTFKDLVVSEFSKMNNINVYLQRVKPYNPKGRSQTLDQAKELDNRILNTLDELAGRDLTLPGRKESTDEIIRYIEDAIRDRQIKE